MFVPSLECLRRKYSGKVEPDLECLRRKLLEEPLIRLHVQAEAKLYFSFSENLQPRWFFKMASKKSSQKQLLQFTAPKAKNRQNFAGGRPPGVFMEA